MVHKKQKRTYSWGKQCPVCGSILKKRVQRKFWMRLIPWSKNYVCGDCSCEYISITGSISYILTCPGLEAGSLEMIKKHR